MTAPVRPGVWGRLAEQIRAMESPGTLAQWVWRGVAQTPALALIDQWLVETATVPNSRTVIVMPPQEGKSQRVSRDFVLWALKNNPKTRVMAASYGQDLATRNAGAVRSAIMFNPKLGLTVDQTNRKKSDWRLTNGVGGVRAVGLDAAASGFSVDLLVIDDPVKNRAEAESPVYREKVWNWWQTVGSARLSRDASVVIITTRWHDDDLVGRLLRDQPDTWRVLNIPAQCEDPATDPLGRAEGEYMISAQGRDHAQWEQRKREVGPAGWQALYQGQPAAAAGDMFQRTWWKRWRQLPVAVRADGAHFLTGFDAVFQSWDFTFKGTDRSDYVVGQVWAARGSMTVLVDQVRRRMPYLEQLLAVRELTAKWPQAGVKLVEDKANGSAVMNALYTAIPGFVPISPTESKTTRAAAVAPFVAAGNVWIPDPSVAPWVNDFVDEHARFPAGVNDDQVDGSTQALRHRYLSGTFAFGAAASGDFPDIG